MRKYTLYIQLLSVLKTNLKNFYFFWTKEEKRIASFTVVILKKKIFNENKHTLEPRVRLLKF